jgi:hypothetical protein
MVQWSETVEEPASTTLGQRKSTMESALSHAVPPNSIDVADGLQVVGACFRSPSCSLHGHARRHDFQLLPPPSVTRSDHAHQECVWPHELGHQRHDEQVSACGGRKRCVLHGCKLCTARPHHSVDPP